MEGFLGWLCGDECRRLYWIFPTPGPFKALKIRTPTLEVEKMFMASFKRDRRPLPGVAGNAEAGQRELRNKNLAVSVPNVAGTYEGTNDAYAKLLGNWRNVSSAGCHRSFAGISWRTIWT